VALLCVLVLIASVVSRSPERAAEAPAAAALDAPVSELGPAVDGFTPVLAHVVAENANVRASAGTSGAVLGALPQGSEVAVVGREGTWSHVRITTEQGPVEGFIASKLLFEGTAEDARALICDVAGSARPSSGEVLSQSAFGRHQITVNAGGRDTLVKLRSNGKTQLAFYVRAGESGKIMTVPEGTFDIMFATGDGFSRKCLEFTKDMQVSGDPNPVAFETTNDGYNTYTSTAEYTLVEQANGNFHTKSVDESAFRE
jgi:hypothetical protein